MDYLCDGGTLWDSDLTWNNNSWPELTNCFENTALTWIPCGYLLLVSPVYVPLLITSCHSQDSSFSRLFILKQVFSALMIGCLSAEILRSSLHTSYFSAEILSYASWIAIMIFHMLLIALERKRSLHRFPVLFVFWILGSVTLFIQLYNAIQRQIYESNSFHFIMLIARSLSSCVLFVLHCFSSHKKSKHKVDSSPYVNASLPSLLFLFWMDPLIFNGFKKPLQEEDLHNLPPKNTAHKVMKKFQRHWDKEVKDCKRRKKRSQKKEQVQEINLCEIPLQSQLNEVKIEQPMSTSLDKKLPRPSYTRALWNNFWFEAFKAQIGKLGRFLDESTSPLILGFFIDYISNNELTWHGYIYSAVIILLKVNATMTWYPSNFENSLMALRFQSTVMGSVLRKSLTISPEARKESTTGEIINLMSVDASNLRIFTDYSFWMWLCTLYFFVGVSLTYSIVGLAILPGCAVIILVMLMNSFILNKMRYYQEAIMKIKDERVKIMNEVLNGIKVIKLYGWEPMFIKKISDVREKELTILWKNAILESIFNFAWRGAMFWMGYFVLVTFVMTDDNHYLDASTAFVSLSYIGLVRLAVNITPIIAQDGIKAITSLNRLNKFMNAQDISLTNLERDTTDNLSVRIVNADFAWEKHGNLTLRGIDLEVQPGKLIAVVGTVGSGKSSLLSAMLGEMHRIRGYANLNSSVAYVPQQAWIQNATVKDNILFGSQCRRKFYETVLRNCCLDPDLKMMVTGDRTEIGEKGINLSGGQKQRISLARAVYSQADIYLLDDPLSAVDSHVGRHIFDQVIGPRGCLQGKTRILVTHGIQWLPEVDQIIVMTDGQISETGSFDELLAQDGDFAQFLTQYFVQKGELDEDKFENSENDESHKREVLQRLVSVTSESDASEIKESQGTRRLLSVEFSDDNEPSSLLSHHDIRLSHTSLHLIHHEVDSHVKMDENSGKGDASKLITDEKAAGGRVSLAVYLYMMKGLGTVYVFIILAFILGYHVTYNYANFWVAEWNDDQSLSNFTEFPANSTDRLEKNTDYIITYTMIGIAQTLCVFVYSFVLHLRHVASCRKVHKELLESVMKAPMRFFDTTPMGRILNRFSQDIETIDTDIIFDMGDVTEHLLKAVGILITISFTLPWFLVVVIPVAFLVCGVQRLFVVNSCQARRLASNRRSPIFAHFSETLSGTSVIRAYQAQDQFITNSNSKVDDCQSAMAVARACVRWMLSRLDMITYLVIGSVCIFAVIMRDDLTPGIIGLTVSYAFTISIEFCLTVEQMGVLETNAVSVERVREYSVLKSEAAWTLQQDSQPLKSSSLWPAVGKIEFKGYSTRYRDGLDLVLKDINCTIHGGEKIGIVGRTGAGKSSMVLSLFRLIEAVSGQIVIDGVDISQIGLHTLRHKITILPQDPVLFAGNLRMNLDPEGEKTDSEVWTALEHSHLKSFVLSLDNKLNHDVGESGENLSMGQRQLVCLARTLLRKTKILVLDEATAAVDMDTDDLIQKTIRSEFSDCTIITIAHRLNTIMDYDRIMVLDSGHIKEFDSPSTLLCDQGSSFYSMARDAGLVGKING